MQKFEINGQPFDAIERAIGKTQTTVLEGYQTASAIEQALATLNFNIQNLTFDEYIIMIRSLLSGVKKIKGPDTIDYHIIVNSISYEESNRGMYNVEAQCSIVEGITVVDKSIDIDNEWDYIVDEDFENFSGTPFSGQWSSGRPGGLQKEDIFWSRAAGSTNFEDSAYQYDGLSSLRLNSTRMFILYPFHQDIRIQVMIIPNTATGKTAVVRWEAKLQGIISDGYTNSYELYLINNASGDYAYLSYRDGTSQVKVQEVTIVFDVQWHNIVIQQIGLQTTIWYDGEIIIEWVSNKRRDSIVGGGTGVVGIDSTSDVNFDTMRVSVPTRSVLALPPGTDLIENPVNVTTLESPYGKFYRVIGSQSFSGKFNETGPDCILYADFRDKNATRPKNYAKSYDPSATYHNIDLISNGELIHNGGLTGHALRLASDLSDPTTASPEKTKFAIFPYQWGFNTIGKATVRLRIKFHEFSTGESPMLIYAHRTSSHKETIEFQMMYERQPVQEFAGTSKIYRIKIIQWSEGSSGATEYIDLELEKYYDFVFIWDYDNNYKMVYLDSEPVLKSYLMTAAPAAIELYSVIGGNTNTDTSIYPTGNYRINASIDLFAIYRNVIHPIKGQGFMPVDNVRTYRVPSSTIIDWWRNSANTLEPLDVAWASRWTPLTSPMQQLAVERSEFPEVGALGTGTPHGAGIWEESDLPEKGFKNAYIMNGLDSRIHFPADRPYFHKYWLGGQATFVFWIKHDSTDADVGYYFTSVLTGSGDYALQVFYQHSGTPALRSLRVEILQGIATSGQHIIECFTDVPDDLWHQYVIVLDTYYGVIYRDGRMVQDQYFTFDTWEPGAAATVTDMPLGTLYPYGAPWAGNTVYSIKGKLHGFFWINKAITKEEIKLLYMTYPRRAGYSPAGYATREAWYYHHNKAFDNIGALEINVLGRWKFNDGDPAHQLTYIHDTSVNKGFIARYYGGTGQTNNTPDANGPQWSPDTPSKHWDYSLSFDGIDDRLVRSGLSAVQYGFVTNDRSYVCIFKTDGTGGTEGLVNVVFNFTNATLTEAFALYNNRNTLSTRCYLRDANVSESFGFNQYLADDKWHIVIITVNRSTNKMNYYVDGKWDSEHTITKFPNSSSNINVGNWSGGDVRYYQKMNICFLEVYASLYTTTEIRAMYKFWFGPQVQEEKLMKRLYSSRDWNYHQKRNVNVIGESSDTIWSENGLTAVRVAKAGRFDQGGIQIYTWAADVDNWDLIGNIALYLEDAEVTSGFTYMFVRSFDLVEVTPNSFIVDCKMITYHEIEEIISDSTLRRRDYNDIIIRVELYGGQHAVVCSIISRPYYSTLNVNKIEWRLNLFGGATYHAHMLGLTEARVTAYLGRASTANNDELDASSPISALIRYGRHWIAFAGGSKESDDATRMNWYQVEGVGEHFSLRDCTIDERFIVGAMQTTHNCILFPRLNNEPNVTYNNMTINVPLGLTPATSTPDGYILRLDASSDYMRWTIGTNTELSPGWYIAFARIYGFSTSIARFIININGVDEYTMTATGDTEGLFTKEFYYDGSGNLQLRFEGTFNGSITEYDHVGIIPYSTREYTGIRDAYYLALQKTKNIIGGRIGDTT